MRYTSGMSATGDIAAAADPCRPPTTYRDTRALDARRGAAHPGAVDPRRARHLGADLARGLDRGTRSPVDDLELRRAVVVDEDGGFLGRVLPDGARLGDRPRARDAARRAAGDRPWLERVRGAGLPRADRVPAADPVRRSHSPALPHAGDDAGERDLPRHVRRVLAAARADDVRRPRRRPDRHRHRSLLRYSEARPAIQDHAAERPPVHHDGTADRIDRRADPRVHGRALHGHAGPRRDAQLRRGVRPDQPGVRARAGHGLPRRGDPLRNGRRRASRPALASVSAGVDGREPAHLPRYSRSQPRSRSRSRSSPPGSCGR